MKNLKIKTLMTSLMAVIIATGAFASDDMKTIMENIGAKQQVVNQDLLKVNQQQSRVKTLGKECREQRGASSIHNRYKQAKAGLKDYKMQLKADNEKLMAAHQAHIDAHKAEVKADVRVLERTQRNLDREKIKGSALTLPAADQLMDARAELRDGFNSLERARISRDKDRWVVNKEYHDNAAKSSLQLSMEGIGNDINRAEK